MASKRAKKQQRKAHNKKSSQTKKKTTQKKRTHNTKHLSTPWSIIPASEGLDRIYYVEEHPVSSDNAAHKVQAAYVQLSKRIVAKTETIERVDLMKHAHFGKNGKFSVILSGFVTDYRVRDGKLYSIMLSSPIEQDETGIYHDIDSHIWLKMENCDGLIGGWDFEVGKEDYNIDVFLGQVILIWGELSSYHDDTRYGIGTWGILENPCLFHTYKGTIHKVHGHELMGRVFNVRYSAAEDKCRVNDNPKETIDGMQALLNMKGTPKFCEIVTTEDLQRAAESR